MRVALAQLYPGKPRTLQHSQGNRDQLGTSMQLGKYHSLKTPGTDRAGTKQRCKVT